MNYRNAKLGLLLAMMSVSAVAQNDTIKISSWDSIPHVIPVVMSDVPLSDVDDDGTIPVLICDSLEVLPPDSITINNMVVDSLQVDSIDSLCVGLDSIPFDSLVQDTVAAPKVVKKKRPTLDKFLQDCLVLKYRPKGDGDAQGFRLDTVSILYEEHLGVLDYLNDPETPERYITYDPAYNRLFLPFTYYYAPVGRISDFDWKPRIAAYETEDRWAVPFDDAPYRSLEQTNSVVDGMLLEAYMHHPEQVKMTEQDLMQVQTFKDDIEGEAQSRPSVVELVGNTPKIGIAEEASVSIRKPNWWVTTGNSSLQFTQNSISNNWYQGGESSISALIGLNIYAKYNNQEGIEWENSLEVNTNFASAPSDTCHNYLVTSDQLRLYSKLGIKAVSKWYYTISTELKTQLFNKYESNNMERKAAFLAPLDWSTSIGMDYKIEKEKYNLSIFLAPFTHSMRYVGGHKVNEVNYGLKEGQSVQHDFGSKVQLNFAWTIIPDIKVTSRVDYLTIYRWIRAEWETKVDFILTKFLTAKLYILARYDDSAAPVHGDNYLQAMETFGLGFGYSW